VRAKDESGACRNARLYQQEDKALDETQIRSGTRGYEREWRDFFKINCNTLFQTALLLTADAVTAEVVLTKSIEEFDTARSPGQTSLASWKEAVVMRSIETVQLSASPALDRWTEASGIKDGCLFRAINKSGKIWGEGMTPKVLWEIVKRAAQAAGIDKLAPHDLRRTCARLCRLAGGELDQIQFLLGHVSIQTTEHYLGCKQKLRFAVNDKIGIEP
jgi:hypothetical protein